MHSSASNQKSKWFGPSLVLQMALALLAALTGSFQAAAQFQVCNNNARTEIRVAISVASDLNGTVDASSNNLATTTSGSTAVAAGECQVILGGQPP